jgi:hypothetical protein|tara:strand:+ start:4901 stop:5035 length:135 start_codon:yes stop_codon:yes gene_type:complete
MKPVCAIVEYANNRFVFFWYIPATLAKITDDIPEKFNNMYHKEL